MSDNIVKDTFDKIMRHIILHDRFESIDAYRLCRTTEYEIECHCGEKWILSNYDLRTCNMEARYVIESVEHMNTPAFMEYLDKVKEQGTYQKVRKEELLDKTGSPTISSLEI